MESDYVIQITHNQLCPNVAFIFQSSSFGSRLRPTFSFLVRTKVRVAAFTLNRTNRAIAPELVLIKALIKANLPSVNTTITIWMEWYQVLCSTKGTSNDAACLPTSPPVMLSGRMLTWLSVRGLYCNRCLTVTPLTPSLHTPAHPHHLSTLVRA